MTLLKGNCLDLLAEMPDNSIDSIVTDPPYELGFMGKSWDNSGISYNVELWAQCLRVLKPGGHLLAFSGSRTYHRMTVVIEDAGFEIRDQIMWLYGSGFPKSLDVSKAIDKAAGLLEHEASRFTAAGRTDKNLPNPVTKGYEPPKPQSPEAQQWQGWGTALKPAFEPVAIAQKPYGNKYFCKRIGSHFASIEAWLQQVLEKQTPTGEAEGSSAQTATSQSEWETTTFLSTVTSWLNILEELYQHESTSTTSTTSSTTTDWKTLCSLALRITPESITKAQTTPNGLASIVSAVDNLLAAAVLSWRGILGLSAIETATGNTPPKLQAEGAVSHEPIVVARKPLTNTVASNVLEWGTGALNIDGSRVGMGEEYDPTKIQKNFASMGYQGTTKETESVPTYKAAGRWPANVIHDGSDEVLARFPTSKSGVAVRGNSGRNTFGGDNPKPPMDDLGYDDSGSAARFFYCAKASKSERNAGLEGLPELPKNERKEGGKSVLEIPGKSNQNPHPTVKPIALMRYLVKLVTPPGGTVLDPFLGSGSTAVAAVLEGFNWIGCEMTEDYFPIIEARVKWAEEQPRGSLPQVRRETMTPEATPNL